MAQHVNYLDKELTAGGGTKNLSNQEFESRYRIFSSGSVTLTSSWTIQQDPAESPIENLLFTIRYEADISLNGNSITFFGTTMPSELTDKQCYIYAKYDGSSWQVIFWPDWDEDNIILKRHLQDGSVDTNELADDSISLVKLDSNDYSQGSLVVGDSSGDPSSLTAGSSGNMLIIDGNGDIVWVTMSGDVNIDGTGATTIQNNSITNSMVPDDTIKPNKTTDNLKLDLIPLETSFESNEIGDYKIRLPFKGQVNQLDAYVTKAIEASDEATITPKDNSNTTMTGGSITLTAGSSIGTGFSSTPTGNNTFGPGDILTFTTEKSTAGGKATLSIEVERLSG